MKYRFLSLLIGACLLSSAPMSADQLFHKHFADGQIAYERKDYPEALNAFLLAAKEGTNAALLHNIGNTYAQMNDGGRAIAHFHKALTIDPRNPETKTNLNLLYQRLGRTPPEPTIFTRIATQLTLNTWVWLAAISFWALVFSLAFPRILNWRPSATWSARIGTTLALIVCALALSGYHSLAKLAVVTDLETPLRPSPSQHSQTVAFLQPGETLSIDKRHGDFTRVTLHSGRSGWVLSSSIIPVWETYRIAEESQPSSPK